LGVLDQSLCTRLPRVRARYLRSHCPRVGATGVARPTITGGMDTCLYRRRT